MNISTLTSKPEKGGKGGDVGGGFPKPSLSAEQKQALEKRLASKDPLTPAPRTRNEMLKDPFRDEYILAEKEELGNLQELGTFVLVDRKSLPRHAKILKTKWVYAVKQDRDGNITKLKARLTAMGCFQREGLDYHDTFASVARTKTLRVMMVIYNSSSEFSCEHWDIKNAFVNAPIDEDIWIELPDGHSIPGVDRTRSALKLAKALYGTKQAAHAWQQFLKKLLAECGGVPLTYDDAVYKIVDPDGGWVLVGTHVDDLFVLCNEKGRAL